MADLARLLSILHHEEHIVIKPFHSHGIRKKGARVKHGKILSRTNQDLFDYQIGDEEITSIFHSLFNRRIILFNALTKQKVLEVHYSRFPFLCKIFRKQDVRCLTSQSNPPQSIGSVQQRLTFGRTHYDIYNSEHEHHVTLVLRKDLLLGRIQHQTPEFEILKKNSRTRVGHIYPFSTDLERSPYEEAVAIKVPRDMCVDTKATLLIAALILKTQLK